MGEKREDLVFHLTETEARWLCPVLSYVRSECPDDETGASLHWKAAVLVEPSLRLSDLFPDPDTRDLVADQLAAYGRNTDQTTAARIRDDLPVFRYELARIQEILYEADIHGGPDNGVLISKIGDALRGMPLFRDGHGQKGVAG